MDHHRIFVGVVVEHDHLEQLTRGGRTDQQDTVALTELADRVHHRVHRVVVRDAVPPSAFGDLHE